MAAGPGRYEEPADVTLMLRVRSDDEAAFAQLYRRYQRRLLNFFYGMGRDADVASELCQETFLRIWKLRKRYRAVGSFPAYLFSFARHIWLEHGRRVQRRRRLGWLLPLDEGLGPAAVSPARRPDEAAELSEIGERIFSVLQGLPEEQRMAFVMRVVEGLSLQDIASVMACPTNTVRSRKILAMRKLRDALKGLRVP